MVPVERTITAQERPTQEGRSRTFSLIGQRGPWKDALRRRMLALADIIAALLASIALSQFSEADPAISLWAAALVPAWLVLAKARGLYSTDHVRIRHQTIDELAGLFDWATLSTAAVMLTLTLADAPGVSAGGAVAMWVTAFGSVCVLRAGARMLWRRTTPAERGLLVGDGQLADAMARKLELEHGHHVSLVDRVGIVDEDGNPAAPKSIRLEDLPRVISSQEIDRVIVAVHDLDEGRLSRITATCRSMGTKLSVAPPLRAMLGTAVELTHLAELPLIEFRTWDQSRSTGLFKRIADVLGAAFLLAILAPFLLALALWVRLDSAGPALYRQSRAGLGGHSFRMLKFRTMVKDADLHVGDVIGLETLGEPMFKLREDPRVTRAGRVLRRWSLDELPQLVNVLRGEMSLVGPRPEESWLVDRYTEAERFRLQMRPGMTGPMQVHGRGELTFSERVAVEREYVENYSIRKDAKILLRTLSAVLRGRGAY